MALAEAMKIDDAIVGPADTLTNKAFSTAQAKEAARVKAFTDLFTKYHGTSEGRPAAWASCGSRRQHYEAAEKIYRDVVDSAPKTFASAAEVSLAQIYAAEGKTAEAEKLLRYRIDHPTELVSSDSATLDLAEVLAPVKPADALKLAEPLTKSDHVAVSKQAINVVGKINLTAH